MEPERFKAVLGRFATGVTVLITGSRAAPHGMTANAFASVSLQPPLVLVCVEQQASTNRLLPEAGGFTVSLLAEGQESLSDRFAGLGHVPPDPFAGLELGIAPSGLPYLADSVGWLDCRLVASYGAGDHTIHVAEVHALGVGPQERPLLYYTGQYWRLLGGSAVRKAAPQQAPGRVPGQPARPAARPR